MHCNTDFYMYQSIISHYWQCHMNVSSYKYKWYSCTKTIIWSHSVLVSAVQERHWHKPTPQRSLQIAQGWSTECKSGSWESMASSLKKRRKRGLDIWWENIERAQIRLGEIPQKRKCSGDRLLEWIQALPFLYEGNITPEQALRRWWNLLEILDETCAIQSHWTSTVQEVVRDTFKRFFPTFGTVIPLSTSWRLLKDFTRIFRLLRWIIVVRLFFS